MRARKAGHFPAAVAVAAVLLGTLAAFTPAASAHGSDPKPAIARVPRLAPTFEGGLGGVAATSASDAWAVGAYSFGSNSSGVLILHWNGKAWRRVTAPSPLDSELLGVTVTSATNAWAVGDYTNNTINEYTLIEHWNGRAWTRVPGPSPRQGAVLLGVAAKSASLAFAVGTTTPLTLPPYNLVGTTFLERWDGHAWREVTKPAPIDGLLTAVAFGSAKSAWTVGTNDSLGYNPNGWTLIERWNGTAWG